MLYVLTADGSLMHESANQASRRYFELCESISLKKINPLLNGREKDAPQHTNELGLGPHN